MADVLIDYDAVNSFADTLGTTGDVIQVLDVVLTGVSMVLIATGFGAAIGSKYLGTYKQHVIDLYNKCAELDGDLKAAVVAIQNGDEKGSRKFV
jgi:hypothetical protein